MGRFLTRDTWQGDYTRSSSLNKWVYVEGNPIINVDPSGTKSCLNSNEPKCITSLQELVYDARAIKSNVQYGVLPPVQGLALLAKYAVDLFGPDIRGAMWGMTRVLNGFDANDGAVWSQALANRTNSTNFIGEDWLPYQNKPDYDKYPWCDPKNPQMCLNRKWVHSQRGDWNRSFWDKTANQAYHFWFYVAVTFFDGAEWADLGNFYHDTYLYTERIMIPLVLHKIKRLLRLMSPPNLIMIWL